MGLRPMVDAPSASGKDRMGLPLSNFWRTQACRLEFIGWLLRPKVLRWGRQGKHIPELLAQYAATRITFKASEAGAGLISWTTRSTGRTDIDAVIYSW